MPESFSGARAMQHVIDQVNFGPRIPETEAHARVVEWIASQLQESGWEVSTQKSAMLGHPVNNIIAKQSDEATTKPIIILGAHYDTRIVADEDPDPNNRNLPVPGANDGASGVAVLLELARILPDNTQKSIWLVFFDAEDNGNIPGWDWIMGSEAYVAGLKEQPEAAIIIDMIGDSDLNIYKEKNSDPELTDEIWNVAASLGYSKQFIESAEHSILDDHIPFAEAGIPAVDIIDFDYPYWHTLEDTPDKVSAESLQAVGETLYAWLLAGQ
jgi:Zn-dependent M28 family amino/carboxypeptidase